MDSCNLNSIGPVRDTKLESLWIRLIAAVRGCQVVACRVTSHQEMGGVGGDVSEEPILPVESISDQGAFGGIIAKAYGKLRPGEAKLKAGR